MRNTKGLFLASDLRVSFLGRLLDEEFIESRAIQQVFEILTLVQCYEFYVVFFFLKSEEKGNVQTRIEIRVYFRLQRFLGSG